MLLHVVRNGLEICELNSVNRLPFIKSFALFCQLSCLAGLSGEAIAADSTAPNATQVVELQYQEVASPVCPFGLNADTTAPRFKKEPSYGQAAVTRGTLSASDNASHSIPFALARDQQKATLCLDLNRDLDLTDDSDGVFTGSGDGYCVFTNLHLTLATVSGSHRYLAGLSFVSVPQAERQPSLVVRGGLRSFWQGKAQLQGQEWQVGVVENPAAEATPGETPYLLARPWAARAGPATSRPPRCQLLPAVGQ